MNRTFLTLLHLFIISIIYFISFLLNSSLPEFEFNNFSTSSRTIISSSLLFSRFSNAVMFPLLIYSSSNFSPIQYVVFIPVFDSKFSITKCLSNSFLPKIKIELIGVLSAIKTSWYLVSIKCVSKILSISSFSVLMKLFPSVALRVNCSS